MIFVIVGTPSQGFPRLIKKMDDIAGRSDEEVVMQIGYEKYRPRYARYFTFIDDFDVIKQLNRRARVVVCHGGIGSIITALEQQTPVIAVPRRQLYGEETDDVQLETVTVLEREGVIKVVHEVGDLEKALLDVPSEVPLKRHNDELIEYLRSYVNSLHGTK